MALQRSEVRRTRPRRSPLPDRVRARLRHRRAGPRRVSLLTTLLMVALACGCGRRDATPRADAPLPPRSQPEARTVALPKVGATLPPPTEVVVEPDRSPSAGEILSPTASPPLPPDASEVPEPGTAGGVTSSAPPGSFAAYARAIVPLVQPALQAAERDGAVLEAAENDPERLCGVGGSPHPDLAADAVLLADLRFQASAIQPPPEAAQAVHEPLLESMRLWGEALDDLNGACGMSDEPLRQGLQRIGAVAKMGGAILAFQSARSGFERLLLAEGLDALAEALRGGR